MTDRRTTIKLILAAAAAVRPGLGSGANMVGPVWRYAPTIQGYGPDPDLLKAYETGEFWPLTLTPGERRLAATLSDLIIPADERSPSASAVGVVDFIDDWVSAPYPAQRADRQIVLKGFAWLDGEAQRRFGHPFVDLSESQQRSLCDDIRDPRDSSADLHDAAVFFARYRDLTAGGFYSTAAGRQDLQYMGNVPLKRFDGPPVELLKRLGLA